MGYFEPPELRNVRYRLVAAGSPCTFSDNAELTFLDHLVRSQLELGELSLPENGAFDVFQIIAEKRHPRGRVLDVLQHFLDEERFVER